jgi:predicted GNAT family N-acyltransferase
MPVEIVVSDFKMQFDAIRAVRMEVFVVEQQIPLELEYDADDWHCTHAVAWDGAKPIGTARLDLKQQGRVGRVSVLRQFRRGGIGTRLMHALEQEARRHGLPKLWFHSQVSAVPFYETLGYRAFGEEYLEADIPHLSMEKLL